MARRRRRPRERARDSQDSQSLSGKRNGALNSSPTHIYRRTLHVTSPSTPPPDTLFHIEWAVVGRRRQKLQESRLELFIVCIVASPSSPRRPSLWPLLEMNESSCERQPVPERTATRDVYHRDCRRQHFCPNSAPTSPSCRFNDGDSIPPKRRRRVKSEEGLYCPQRALEIAFLSRHYYYSGQ